MTRRLATVWIAATLVGSCGLGGCSNGGGGHPPPPPVVPHPLDVLGQDCLGCHEHETWDFAALHDRVNPAFDDDCIKCHGTLLDEATLAPDRVGPHARMLPEFFALDQTEPTNANCHMCHYSADLVQGSGADLRRQVPVSWCWACHKDSGPFLPALYPN